MATYPHTVNYLEAPVVTGYGGTQVRDWTKKTSRRMRCSVQPVSSSEDNADRETIITRWRWRWPMSSPVPVTSEGRVEWLGQVMDIDGDIEEWRPERPRHGHRAAFLRMAVDR